MAGDFGNEGHCAAWVVGAVRTTRYRPANRFDTSRSCFLLHLGERYKIVVWCQRNPRLVSCHSVSLSGGRGDGAKTGRGTLAVLAASV